MKTGVEIISEERQRQIIIEGYTSENDDKNVNEDIAVAASCYALPDTHRNIYAGVNGNSTILRTLWPWGWEWFKPTPEDRVRELAKAGALIAAEIDRINRLNIKE